MRARPHEDLVKEVRKQATQLRQQADQILLLEAHVKIMEDEIQDYMDQSMESLNRASQGLGNVEADFRKDIEGDCIVSTFKFERPETIILNEDMNQIRNASFKSRDKWLRRMRWQFARRWAEHASEVFTRYMTVTENSRANWK